VAYAGHVVQSVASEPQNVDALFFLLGWYRYGFHKKHIGIPYAELVFLHPVVPVDHVVHFSAFGALNIDTLFSCSGGMSKDCTKSVMGHVKMNFCFCIVLDLRVTLCIAVFQWRETSTHYFSCLGGTGTDSRKSVLRYVTPNLCFASGGICGSRTAF
jgi:hypothetical protein